MKNIIYTLALLFSFSLLGQEFEVNIVQIDSGPNLNQGTFKYIKPVLVLESEGSAKELFDKTINWVNETYKNPDEVIKGKIDGEYLRLNGFKSNLIKVISLGSMLVYDARYTIEIKFRDNRFRYEVTKLEQYFPPSQFSTGGWVEKSFGFRTAKRKGKPNRKTGERAAGKIDKSGTGDFETIKSYFENLGLSIREYADKKVVSSETEADEDW